MEFIRELAATPGNRSARILKLEEMVDELEDSTEEEDEVLIDMIIDLAYYVEDPKLRAQDGSYYGEERLQSEISEALSRLARLQKSGDQADEP
jgi:hypothetical protein